MTQATLPAGTVDTFTYNGDGQRVQKQDSAGTANHVWDEQNILLETNASNVTQVVYTLEPAIYGNLISQRRSGTASVYLFDGLGATTQLANATGSVTDNYLYDSFGNILLSGSTANPFCYLGRMGYYENPDLLQYYVRARYYDPASGRFTSRDPLAASVNQSDYTYVGNNPASVADPSGMDPTICALGPLPCLYGNWCGPRCPLPTETPPAIDCLDASCMDHDICYRKTYYFNVFCDQTMCLNVLWCLTHSKCKTWKCSIAISSLGTLFCGNTWRSGYIWPLRPIPPTGY